MLSLVSWFYERYRVVRINSIRFKIPRRLRLIKNEKKTTIDKKNLIAIMFFFGSDLYFASRDGGLDEVKLLFEYGRLCLDPRYGNVRHGWYVFDVWDSSYGRYLGRCISNVMGFYLRWYSCLGVLQRSRGVLQRGGKVFLLSLICSPVSEGRFLRYAVDLCHTGRI